MNGLALQVALHWAALGFYLAATAAYAHSLLFQHPGRARIGTWLAGLGLLPHTAALGLRWVESGHGPYMMQYEVLSSNAWIAVAMLLLFVWRRPSWFPVALVALPVSLLMVGIGIFSNPEARDLPPTLRSMWLVFHVLFAKLAGGAFVLSLGSAVMLLRKARHGTGPLLDRLPGVEALDAYTIRMAAFGFVLWTVTVGAGAVWANESWGRYWGWDPIETWSLVTWLCYGTLLHARRFWRLSGTRLAWATIACFGTCLLTIFVLPFAISSLHSAYFQ